MARQWVILGQRKEPLHDGSGFATGEPTAAYAGRQAIGRQWLRSFCGGEMRASEARHAFFRVPWILA
jgi:hypothetical protein